MAEQLADLPTDSVEYAITAWGRGDASHLSSYLQDHTRIGVFFPKPAELRAIAEFHYREQRQRERDRERVEREAREARHRAEHPEQYVSMSDLVREHYESRGQRQASTLPVDQQFTNPVDKIMNAYSKAMYAGAEYEPMLVAQVHEWRAKQEEKQVHP